MKAWDRRRVLTVTLGAALALFAYWAVGRANRGAPPPRSCLACSSDADCAACGKYCRILDRSCVECRRDADCDAGERCASAACAEASPPADSTPTAVSPTTPRAVLPVVSVYDRASAAQAAELRALVNHRDYRAAADRLVLLALPGCSSFLAGHWYALAGANDLAAAQFRRVEPACGPAVRSRSRLRAARALLALGRATEARAELDASQPEPIFQEPPPWIKQRQLLSALAAVQSSRGTLDDAARIRSLVAGLVPGLDETSDGRRVQLAYAEALLNQCDEQCDPPRAWRLLQELWIEHPKWAESTEFASKLETLRQAAARAVGVDAAVLGESEKLRWLQSWVQQDAARARTVLTAALRPTSESSNYACKLRMMYARTQTKDPAGWQQAVRACAANPDEQAAALYNLARAFGKHKVGAKPADGDAAVASLLELEQRFPAHKLADDARLLRAEHVLDNGDEAQALRLLAEMGNLFPNGDQTDEGLFTAFLIHARAGRWREGREVLLQSAGRKQQGDVSARVEYFLARSTEQLEREPGNAVGVRSAYQRVIDRHPGSYYAILAMSRLPSADGTITRPPGVSTDEPEVSICSACTSSAFDAIAEFLPFEILEDLPVSTFVKTLATRDKMAFIRILQRANLARDALMVAQAELGRPGSWPTSPGEQAKWIALYPNAYSEEVVAASATTGVPKALIWAIMRKESRFDSEARSPAAAVGLMQLLASTANDFKASSADPDFSDATLREPAVSIRVGARLLARLRKHYADNVVLAIAAYNLGQGALDRWLKREEQPFDVFVESLPTSEVRDYVKSVLAAQLAYGLLYDEQAVAEVLALPMRVGGLPGGD